MTASKNQDVLENVQREIGRIAAGGMQDTLALDLEQFHGWLITLTPERITDGAKRELILRYQSEACRYVSA